jgi:hypothetical protein
VKTIFIYEQTDYCKLTDAPCAPEKCQNQKDSCTHIIRKSEIRDEREL